MVLVNGERKGVLQDRSGLFDSTKSDESLSQQNSRNHPISPVVHTILKVWNRPRWLVLFHKGLTEAESKQRIVRLLFHESCKSI